MYIIAQLILACANTTYEGSILLEDISLEKDKVNNYKGGSLFYKNQEIESVIYPILNELKEDQNTDSSNVVVDAGNGDGLNMEKYKIIPGVNTEKSNKYSEEIIASNSIKSSFYTQSTLKQYLSNNSQKVSNLNQNRIAIKQDSVNLGAKIDTINKENSLIENNFTIAFKDQIQIKILNKKPSYQANKNHTLIIQVSNKGDYLNDLSLNVVLPNYLNIISLSKIGYLDKKETKLCYISFFVNSDCEPGDKDIVFQVLKGSLQLEQINSNIYIEENNSLELFNLYSPKQVQAGEAIKAKFAIRNTGNIAQEVVLKSRSNIQGEKRMLIPKDSTIVVNLSQETNSKIFGLRRVNTNLEVTNTLSNKTYYGSQITDVIPSIIKQKDPFLRYPMSTSLYFSSYTNEYQHYSAISAELKGNGYLDEDKNHHLNFIIRAPKREGLRRFNIVDQYSLIYNHKKNTTLYLGDHSYFINRLGFGVRYGIGFKLDHNINNWTFSAFYSKPRLYNFNRKPLYGVKLSYRFSDSTSVGVTLEKSEGNSFVYRNSFNKEGKGQILTFDYDYQRKNTTVNAELSGSFNQNTVDFGTDIRFLQRLKSFSFSSNMLLTGRNYFGNITNSLQHNNSLNYNKRNLNVGLGHTVSRVNKKLDPVLYEIEPYFESYFATLGYRFSNHHFINFRFDKRYREDQLEPVNYKYDEYGFNYNFNYTNKLFTGNFGGRFAKTQNQLSLDNTYKNTYINHANVSYRIFRDFTIRGGVNHIYTNRYGTVDYGSNYIRYNLGFNYNLLKKFVLNANYNSGFSPEESYRQRDYINFNLRANISEHHRLEMRANYFENPAVINRKELFAFAKYSYLFGVGVKRLFNQGGVKGSLFSNNSKININGIKIYTAGKTIQTDKNGNFELNNLNIGLNNIYVDESTLPLNVVLTQKNPIEIYVEKDRKVELELELVKAGKLFGVLNLVNKNKAIETSLQCYIKLENKDFVYYTESNINGEFKFQNVVPGNYICTLIRFKKNGNLFNVIRETSIAVEADNAANINIPVKGKERKIKFINSNLKVGYNE